MKTRFVGLLAVAAQLAGAQCPYVSASLGSQTVGPKVATAFPGIAVDGGGPNGQRAVLIYAPFIAE